MTSFADDIERIFSAWDRPDLPGCAALIVRDGVPLYRRGHGMASLEHRVPITPSTVFNVGSISKQFTALAILLLEEEGKVSLDDDIRRYVPELGALHGPITLRHLMHHTSGLREQSHLLALAGWRDGDVVTERDILDLVARQRALNFAPGEDFQYSNPGQRQHDQSRRARAQDHRHRHRPRCRRWRAQCSGARAGVPRA